MTSTAASISINFEELQRELQAFNELFGLWTEQRRRALMDDKDAYLKTLSEEQDTVEALKKQYQQLLQHRQQIQQVLEAEEQERSEYTRQNQEYTQQRDSLKQKLTIIIRETELMEVEIMKESRILEARNRTREVNREQRMSDLDLYREKLGISVVSLESSPNHTKVIFTQIDPQDPTCQFSFCVDHSDMVSLRPFQFSPQLPADLLQTVLSKPQANFYQLLAQVRSCFVKCL